jgi:hypothetical protein
MENTSLLRRKKKLKFLKFPFSIRFVTFLGVFVSQKNNFEFPIFAKSRNVETESSRGIDFLDLVILLIL